MISVGGVRLLGRVGEFSCSQVKSSRDVLLLLFLSTRQREYGSPIITTDSSRVYINLSV
ncbi:hypothetical protein CSUI_011339 [Cystoisospora suis]|uniref:Uncharacterized protein n=1 Tax=Cystoisospora suis TaxID=483139 RepID=A0A2C6JSW9_9APIC|nr:hypothetical protein CSUI_011339 [Cystoisospora suis]